MGSTRNHSDSFIDGSGSRTVRVGLGEDEVTRSDCASCEASAADRGDATTNGADSVQNWKANCANWTHSGATDPAAANDGC